MGYDVTKHGAVVAIRIYMGDHYPLADIRTAFGFGKTIVWTNVADREEFKEGINGYTLFYDERDKAKFEDWHCEEIISSERNEKILAKKRNDSDSTAKEVEFLTAMGIDNVMREEKE